jgi:2-phosphoglycerate kinase
MQLCSNTPVIYWIGGSTCAGKTTIANIISEKYSFKVYHCDEYLGKHIDKSNAQEHPNLNRVTKMSWNDILNMSVEEYLNWTIGLFKEEFEMIIEDLSILYDGKPILVEGVGLFPELINNVVFDKDHAIWVVADEKFYKKHQRDRKELFERIKECLNPEKALQNYMDFDLAMGRYIINDAKKLALNVIEVKNDNDIEENIEFILSKFKMA